MLAAHRCGMADDRGIRAGRPPKKVVVQASPAGMPTIPVRKLPNAPGQHDFDPLRTAAGPVPGPYAFSLISILDNDASA
jgi:hypothetical protein